MPELVVIAHNPYNIYELDRFELLVIASNNPDPQARLAARAALAHFVRVNGKAKCDLMMEALNKKHGTTEQ